jgi:hypothetical protein
MGGSGRAGARNANASREGWRQKCERQPRGAGVAKNENASPLGLALFNEY